MISKLDRKIAKQQIVISKNPRTILKSNPSGLELCRNLIVRSVLIPDFLKETSANWNFCTSVGLRLDQAKRNVFFLTAHFITLPLIHSLREIERERYFVNHHCSHRLNYGIFTNTDDNKRENKKNFLHLIDMAKNKTVLRENLLIFPCVLFETYLFVNFHI